MERSLICAQHHQEMHELQDIMYAMDQSYEDRDADARIEFQSQRDELKNKVTTSMPQLLIVPSAIVRTRSTGWLKINPAKRKFNAVSFKWC